jgi:hypothetical protein
MEDWRLKMESRRVYGPVVADYHNNKEEMDPNSDSDPHPDPY